MKYIYAFCLLLCCMTGYAQTSGPLYLNDSLVKHGVRGSLRDREWRLIQLDSPQFASPGYDDSGWKSGVSYYAGDARRQLGHTDSVHWLRMRLLVDTDFTEKPVAIRLYGDGAAAVYLDGRLLQQNGDFYREQRNGYIKLQSRPVFLSFGRAGEHLLAIRYENRPADADDKPYVWGFFLSFADPASVVRLVEDNTRMPAIFMLTLGSLFGTLFFVHLLMFLFYKRDISNLYFALFNLSLSVVIIVAYTILSTDLPFDRQKGAGYVMLVSGVLSCYSIVAFSTHLFSKSRIPHIVSLVLYSLVLLTFLLDNIISSRQVAAIMGIMIAGSALFVVILIIRAMWRKVPGSRILGAGILFFILFVTSLTIAAIASDGQLQVENPVVSAVIFLFALLAVFSIPLSLSSYLAWRFAATSKDLQLQLDNVAELSRKSLQQEQEKQLFLLNQKTALEQEVWERTKEITAQKQVIEAEKQKSDELLLNILPAEVAEELKLNGHTKAQHYDEATVLFTDFVNFTQTAERLEAEELLSELNTCFTAFDNIMERYGLEKIKTIGDAYLAVSGLPLPHPDHAVKAVSAALDIVRFMAERREGALSGFDIRIGINSGSLVAGIVGIKKFAYDIWGDTVNIAARMEQSGEAGRINISERTYQLVRGQFTCTYRGKIKAKNKGDMDMYFVEAGPHASPAG